MYFSWPLHELAIKTLLLDKSVSHTLIWECEYFWHLDISSSYIPMMTAFFIQLTAIPLHHTPAFQHAGTERYPSVHLKGYRLRRAAIISSHINKGEWGLFDWTVTQANHQRPHLATHSLFWTDAHPLYLTSSLEFWPKRPVCLAADCWGPVSLDSFLAGVLRFFRIRHLPLSVVYLWFDLCRMLAERLM